GDGANKRDARCRASLFLCRKAAVPCLFRCRALAVRLRLGLAHAGRAVLEIALGLERRTIAEGFLLAEGFLAGEGRAAAGGFLAGGVGRFAIAGDAQLLTGAPDGLEMLHHIDRHARGQVDQAVVLEDLDTADVFALQAGFVGDGTDDVARLHAVVVADFDAESFQAGFRLVRRAFFFREGRALGAFAAFRTIAAR